MNERFSVGEIAILHGLYGHVGHLNGVECQVISELAPRTVRDIRGTLGMRETYLIVVDGMTGAISPKYLRKRRPPATGEQIIRAMFVPTAQPIKEGEPA